MKKEKNTPQLLCVMKDNTNALDLVLVSSVPGIYNLSKPQFFNLWNENTKILCIYFTELSVPDELMYTKYTKMLWELKCIIEIFLDDYYHNIALTKIIF